MKIKLSKHWTHYILILVIVSSFISLISLCAPGLYMLPRGGEYFYEWISGYIIFRICNTGTSSYLEYTGFATNMSYSSISSIITVFIVMISVGRLDLMIMGGILMFFIIFWLYHATDGLERSYFLFLSLRFGFFGPLLGSIFAIISGFLSPNSYRWNPKIAPKMEKGVYLLVTPPLPTIVNSSSLMNNEIKPQDQSKPYLKFCGNCGAEKHSPFCHECGQKD
jgi:hypothetical protein